MKHLFTLACALLVFALQNSFAQRGIHGPRTVAAANTIVNEYTAVTVNIAAGATTIPVGASSLNSNGRFSSNLAAGDLIMIYQVQGAIINGSLAGTIATPLDTSWGRIMVPGNCGYYELAQVSSIPDGTSIVIDCGTRFAYSVGGTNRTQVIRIPRYTNLTVNTGGVLTCDDWNGTIGGVLAVEVDQNTIVNGTINATGRGFRGGTLVGDNLAGFANNMGSTDPAYGARKGEGIAGNDADYDPMGGRYGRGAAANGGGGGCGNNGGGGGGANGGATANWKGMGVPDPNGAYTAAWNLDPTYGLNYLTTLNTSNSSGGGRGGYSWGSSNQNAGTTGPGNGAWGGANRAWDQTGLGGRPIAYTADHFYFGGGGGAGDQNNNFGGIGGDGGGAIFIMNYGTISGSGSVISNGSNGANSQGTPPNTSYSGSDGAGGGGGGGAIILNSVGAISGITINANGGYGGNQVMVAGPFFFGTINESQGPGGGGGGGYIACSNGSVTQTANGGNNGTTSSPALSEFPPNGAMRGGTGTIGQTVTNYTWSVSGATICAGQTATLTVTINGTPPPGVTVRWYTSQVGGASFSSLNPMTTPVLSSTTTYYVGTCPGTYRIPVVVTVGAPSVSLSATANPICVSGSTTLNAGGASTYTWMPGSLSGSSVNVSPSSPTTYTVTGTDGSGCTGTNTITITVNANPTVSSSASPPSVLCNGGSSTVTVAASGGSSPYTGVGAFVQTAGSYTYTVTDNNGCSGTTSIAITEPTALTANSSATSVLCNGGNSTVTVTGVGGTAPYSGVGTFTRTAGTYTFTVTDANACTSTTTITITEPSVLTTSSSATSVLCNGGNSTVTVAASGGTTPYSGEGAFTQTAGTYLYTITDGNGCTSSTSITITEPTALVASSSATSVLCNGGNATVTVAATGGTSPYSGEGTFTQTAGTYSYTITDGNGCTSSTSVAITEPTVLVASSSATSVLCNGGNSTVTVAASGGTSPYSGEGTFTQTAGTYSYTITDGNGCTSSTSVTITEPTALVASSSATSVLCNGGNSTVTVSASGGTSPFSGDGTFTQTAGTYSYTVTDLNGCTSSTSVTITEPTALTVSSSATSVLCNGGNSTVTVSASGGTSPYTGEGTFTQTAGTYSYSVTDMNGCTGSASVIITEPAVLVGSLAVADGPTTCNGMDGNVDITVSGGTPAFTYQWDNSAVTEDLSGITAGTYSCSVTDLNGCTASLTVTLTDPAPPVVVFTPVVNVLCADDGGIALGGGSPVGGVYSGASVTAGIFTPSLSNVGPNLVVYTYSDPTTNCSSSDSVFITVDICLGNSPALEEGSFDVYPNPGTGIFTLELNTREPAEVFIYDALGQLVITQQTQPNTLQQFTLSDPGVYLVLVVTADGAKTTKRVVSCK